MKKVSRTIMDAQEVSLGNSNILPSVIWFFVNAGMGALLSFGVQGVVGASNLFGSVTSVYFVLSVFGFFHAETRRSLFQKGRSVPGWLSHGVGIVFIGVSYWAGWFVIGTLWVFIESLENRIFDCAPSTVS